MYVCILITTQDRTIQEVKMNYRRRSNVCLFSFLPSGVEIDLCSVGRSDWLFCERGLVSLDPSEAAEEPFVTAYQSHGLLSSDSDQCRNDDKKLFH